MAPQSVKASTANASANPQGMTAVSTERRAVRIIS